MNFKMVSGYGRVIGMAKIKIKIFDISHSVFVFVLDTSDFSHEILLGLDLIKEFKLYQDKNLNIFQKKDSKGVYCMSDVLKSRNLAFVNFVQLKADLSHLNKSRSIAVHNIIQRFNFAFAQNKFDVGKVSAHEAAVKLTEHRYVYRKPYRCNIIDQREIENQISE